MRFTLKSTFVTVGLAAVGFLAVRDYLDRLPLSLKPYSRESRDDALGKGRCLLVTIYGNWTLTTSDPLRWLSHDVTRQIRRRNMLTMSADWTNRDSHVTALMNEIGVTSVPALAFYSPAEPDKPTVILDLPNDDDVLNIIDSCCR